MTKGAYYHGAPRRLSAEVAKLTQPLCHRIGIVRAAIILDWEKIVGEQFSTVCDLLYVRFPPGRRTDGTVYVATHNSMSVHMRFYDDQLLLRINRYYGYEAVCRIAYQQKPWQPTSKESKMNNVMSKTFYEESALLTQELSTISNPALQKSLQQLGDQLCRLSPSSPNKT